MSLNSLLAWRRLDRHVLALGAALVAGTALRLVGLDRQGFWTDELYVVWEGRQPLDVLFNPQLHIQHPPGYRLLLHSWMGISLDETWIRLVSMLAGILLIPVGWALARLLWPTNLAAGDCAALLVATSPYMLHYSQDVTTYSWTSLWVTLSFLLLVAAWRSDRPWLWVAWGASLAVSLYSHYFAFFPLLFEGGAVLVLGSRDTLGRRKLPHALAAIAGAGVLYAPWLWQLWAHGGNSLGTYFFPLTLDGQAFHWLPVLMAGYAHAPFWQSGLVAWLAWLGIAACAVWAVWSLSVARDKDSDALPLVQGRAPSEDGGGYEGQGARSASGLALVAGWMVAAIAGPYLFLRITTPPDAVDPVRFATMAAPALLVGLAAVVALLRPLWRLPLLALWLVLVAWQWRAEILTPPVQDWRGILATVRQQAEPGDVVLAFPAFHASAAAAYYPVAPLDGSRYALPVRGGWFVGEGSDPTGAAYWFPPDWQWRGFLNSEARRSTDWTNEIKARTGDARRIWYLSGDGVDGTYPPSPAAEHALTDLGWHATSEWKASPLVLRLYTSSAR